MEAKPEAAPVAGSSKSPIDVVVIGGGLMGSIASIMLQRRGLRTLVLESRPRGKEQKVLVGEAITEGTSVFLRHELGMEGWLKQHVFRKFGFDFVTLPRGDLKKDSGPERIEDCHELLLSTTPLEKIPNALRRLIPTYHVERTSLNAHVAQLARQEGAQFLEGAVVAKVVIDDSGKKHEVHYSHEGQERTATCRWVIDCSGRRTLLGRQLGITRQEERLRTSSVWNRFENVESDPAVFRTFHGIDRRRHTIHFTGTGFWIWWIHLSEKVTSVGVSYDKDQHQPDLRTEDKGFGEMIAKFPVVARLLANARPLEPYQYYAHLPYKSDHWLSEKGYALIGDAAWFTDALYSIGIETACRQLINCVPMIVDTVGGASPNRHEITSLNEEFTRCQNAVVELNLFKYKHAWASPHQLVQTAIYELGEIAELYHLQDKANWTPQNLRMYYRLQWYSQERIDKLRRFLDGSRPDDSHDLEPGAKLVRKGLIPGALIYNVTWPLWSIPGGTPIFFALIRGWAVMERMSQRYRLWPDGLGWMARSERVMRPILSWASGSPKKALEAHVRDVAP